jgi:nitrite reductase (NADH) large subunit
MIKQKLVLIGNGMAGIRCIEEILKINPHGFDITVFGSEPHPNYNRILLSKVLQGDTTIDDITLNDWSWYKTNNIQLCVGEEVIKIDKENQVVYSNKNRSVSYDKLIIATGSVPFILPIPGANKKGVTAFRDIKDCETMLDYSKSHKKAVVIGGGLLGLEAARGLLNLGMQVDVVHIADYLMERQLDKTTGTLLQKKLEKQGMNFLLKKQTAEIIGEDSVEGIRFSDGSEVKTDLVVMAVGIRPNALLAEKNGIHMNRGILVNDYLETDTPNIYAVGECAEHRKVVYGLVAPLYEQGKVLAKRICGISTDGYQGSVLSTQLKVSGVDVFSAGQFREDNETKSYQVYDEWNNSYKKVLIRDEKIVGAVLFGNTSEGNKLLRYINQGASFSEYTNQFTVSDADSKENFAAIMADDELICGCNGVTKEEVVKAISSKGLKTVEEIKGCTNASRSCGGCKPLVSDLLAHTLGDEFDQSEQKQAICTCTTLSRDEVVQEIKDKQLTHLREVMSVLGWKDEEGCSKCRPALNYYLGMVHPEEYVDERESRYVNERLHANIQKDGTYSVVPRMYGGVTNAAELRKIANVADKYEVPLIKITGGQRVDLLGIKKEDLPKMWEDLDMPSGYAYGKSTRTVKTCVGENFCRFGTQDSIGMGIALEKKFERLNTPHKVKMAVSACPRNCAESGIKDLGVVGVEGSWELYIGGNGGTHLRAGDLLIKVKTKEEVLEFTGAYLQYYRETANYLERTSEWVERMGLNHIQSILKNKSYRNELNERIEQALSGVKDPWKEAIESKTIQKELYTNVLVPVDTK